MQLRVTAIRDDGSYWAVDVRTLRQALKVARRLRWQEGWPAWICDHDEPGDRRSIACWQQWRERRERRDYAWFDSPTAGIH